MSETSSRPFLLRFADPLEECEPTQGQYDSSLQISRVPQGACWVDALDVSADKPPQTITTHVRRETTDNS